MFEIRPGISWNGPAKSVDGSPYSLDPRMVLTYPGDISVKPCVRALIPPSRTPLVCNLLCDLFIVDYACHCKKRCLLDIHNDLLNN